MPYLFSLLVVAATVFAVVDIITRDEGQVRHMPKVVWLLLVILLPLLGVVLWFTIGREYPERDRPVRSPRGYADPPPAPSAPMPPRDTRTTEQQLADLEREIEQERRRAEARRRAQDGQSAE
ncbi:PLDc N-terminal domain-containing protein [Microbacterium luticocti]|uniref:PLDc N-terminal domain-containing protein n=1 Tax=Microbacterium luticocti TaxID=451764 RepID=UPI00048C9E85|nr:PLDc N-terminal domain-containing protein [Microbacterium luticocti]